MSKLQELIKELCPDGVEFKKLEEVCEIFSGKNKQKKEQGNILFMDQQVLLHIVTIINMIKNNY